MKTYLKSILFVICFFISVNIIAQSPPPPPSDPSGGGVNGPVGAPIDGGAGILLALGVAYGCLKLSQARKMKKIDVEV